MTRKEWLEQIAAREQQVNDEVFSLLRYANEETDGHDTTLGAAMIRLVQGYGQGGGGGYEIHEVEFESTGNLNFKYAVQPKYIGECAWFYFYPLDASNTNTQTICVGYSDIPDLPTSPTGVKLLSPVQYYINDQSYNVIRMRGNIPGIPVGRYKLVWLGTAK